MSISIFTRDTIEKGNTVHHGGLSGLVFDDDNFIYISHLGEDLKYWYLPVSPDTLQDNMTSNFQPTNALGRSAPIYTYSSSGPRNVQFNFSLLRDLMDEVNVGRSNSKPEVHEDYIENLIHALQAIALPRYNLTNQSVEPPMVAVKIGEQLFVKGVVTSGISCTYNKPILADGKYNLVAIGFTVAEVDPYDATEVYKNGSFRGITETLRTGMNAGGTR